MRRNPNIFSITTAVRFALAAGQALAGWRRALTRDASRIKTLSRTCDWVERLTSLSPTLRDEPLFGRCIGELAASALATGDTANAAQEAQPRVTKTQPRPFDITGGQRQRRPAGAGQPYAQDRGSGTQPGTRRRRSGSSPDTETDASTSPETDFGATARHINSPRWPAHSTASSQRHSPATAAELPRLADRDLLESCANLQSQVGQSHAKARSRGIRRPANGGVPSRGSRTGPKTTSRLRRTEPAVAAPRHDAFRPIVQSGGLEGMAESFGETFLQRLVRRTLKRLCHLQRSADGDTPKSEWLGEQWATRLDGTTVPSDWLGAIVAGESNASGTRPSGDKVNSSSRPADARRSEAANSGSGRNRLSQAFRPSHERDRARSPYASVLDESEMGERRHGLPPGLGVTAEASAFSHSNQYAPGDRLADELDDERGGAHEIARLSQVERVTPPAVASSLSALSSLPETTAFSGVLPLASEIARQDAREEAHSPEDLDALAAKIKLILDEEARRHGIDV